MIDYMLRQICQCILIIIMSLSRCYLYTKYGRCLGLLWHLIVTTIQYGMMEHV